MNELEKRKKNRYKVILSNITMVVSVVVIATLLVLITMGYGLNKDMSFEQSGLVQFASYPSGATVNIDGENLLARTSAKSSLTTGKHDFNITKSGYDTWSKKAVVQSGRVLWLNYARLFPTEKVTKNVREFPEIESASVSKNRQYILVVKSSKTGAMELINIKDSDLPVTNMNFSNVLSEISNQDISHKIDMVSWNNDNNKVIARHTYGENVEWVVLDIKNTAASKNLTTTYRLGIYNPVFASNDGKKIFALENGNLRRINLGDNTVSAALTTNVDKITIGADNAVLFVSNAVDNIIEVGVYRDGEKGSSTIHAIDKSIEEVKDAPVFVSGGEYYNESYIVIAHGKNLMVLKGSYPMYGKPIASLTTICDIEVGFSIEKLTMSSSRRLILVSNGENVINYDLETDLEVGFKIDKNKDGVASYSWIDDFMIYTRADDELKVYDFDGENQRHLTSASSKFPVTISPDNKNLYSFVVKDNKTYLQRLVIVP